MEKFPEGDQLIQPLDTRPNNVISATEASLRPATAHNQAPSAPDQDLYIGQRDRCRRLDCDIGSPCGRPAGRDRPAGGCAERTTSKALQLRGRYRSEQPLHPHFPGNRPSTRELVGVARRDPDFRASSCDQRSTAARSSSRSAGRRCKADGTRSMNAARPGHGNQR